MNEEMLAILGGAPARSKPFLVEPMTGEEEEALVLEAMREKNYSRYIGMAVPEVVLRMTSAEAAALDDYWHVLGGKNVRAFAAEFAEKMNVPYAIPVSSATVGISTALAAAGIGAGDEVIVPALSFSATATAVLMFNSIPVFVDIDPGNYCLNPSAIESAITPRTKAILVVHLAGNVADMDSILQIARKYGLKVIEDACQAIGASWGGIKAGAIGDAGIFSFQQSKNIMTGEGGMIITRDPDVAARARLISNHGELQFDDKSTIDEMAGVVGFNFRLPELCAAVGRAQLRKLDAVNAWRTKNYEILRRELEGLPGIHVPPSLSGGNGPAQPVPHFLVAHYDEEEMRMPRALFVAALRAEGIPVGTGYSRPLYANPTFLKKIAYGKNGSPWTDAQYGGSVKYYHGMAPVTEDFLYRRFLWFYHIAYSCTADDMRDIGRAVRKVVEQRSILAAKAEELRSHTGGHSAGRIGVDPNQVKGSVRKVSA